MAVSCRRQARLHDVNALDAGWWHGTAVHADGSVWMWGFNDHGQIGDGDTLKRIHRRPNPVSGIDNAIAVGGGLAFTLAVTR